MHNHKKQEAFTLVELIVVITILAILGTIAFISLQGYSTQARDSTRIADMGSMQSSLELFKLESGKYPEPTNITEITYSGALAWSQGIFGETVYANVDKLDKIPTDPLTDKEYVYSTTNTRNEFQLAGIMEGDEVSFSNQSGIKDLFLNNVKAIEKTALLKVTGTYNGKILKVSTGVTDCIVASPSIITSSGTTLETITTNNLLSYNGYKNLPFQYGGTYKTKGEENLNLVNSGNLEIYCGSIKNLSEDTSTGTVYRQKMIKKLQLAYLDTSIKDIGEINNILIVDTSDAKSSEKLSTSIISNNLGGNILAGSENPTGWTALDTNCDIPDITIGTQTWAGCNSTLGTGIEYNVDQNCWNYIGGLTSGCNRPSNEKENIYNPTYGINNIWGKLYTWDSMDTDNDDDIDINDTNKVCPNGRQVPTDQEWEILETKLNGGINCRNATNGYSCNGLGWGNHTLKDSTNNIVEALQIPLSGYRNTAGVTFYFRGYNTSFWTSTSSTGNSYSRGFSGGIAILRNIGSQANGYSVRCIKN